MGKRKNFPGHPGEGSEERSIRVRDVAAKVASGFYFKAENIDAIADVMSGTILDCVFR